MRVVAENEEKVGIPILMNIAKVLVGYLKRDRTMAGAGRSEH